MPQQVKRLIPIADTFESIQELSKILPPPWKFSYEVKIGGHRRAVCEALFDGSMTKDELERMLQDALDVS